MSFKYEITATIVLYHEDIMILQKTVDSFLKIPLKKKLFLVDNSATRSLSSFFIHEEIEYIFSGKNIGFGKGHNFVLEKLNSKYHLLLNPDIVFTEDVISILIDQLERSKQNIMLFDIPLVEVQWTQESVLKHFNVVSFNELLSNQIMGGYILLKKNQKSIDFIKDWLKLCSDSNLIIDQKKNKNPFYISHREDQSILSLLAKREGLIPFSDPSDYGKFPARYISSGIIFYQPKSRLPKYEMNDVVFLAVRKSNILVYYFKYRLRILFDYFI